MTALERQLTRALRELSAQYERERTQHAAQIATLQRQVEHYAGQVTRLIMGLLVDTFRKADTMSTMAVIVRPRRARRQFTDEFKAGAVRLVLDEGKTVGQVARELDLTESALRHWVERERADRTNGRTGLTTEEREELRRHHTTLGQVSPAEFERRRLTPAA